MNVAYPTRDHIIPAAQFEVLMAMLDPLESAAQFRTMTAVSLGTARDLDERGRAQVKRAAKRLGEVAYPKIPIDDTPTDDDE